MKKNLLKIYESFFDDLDKLNQDKVNDEFGRTNANIYDEHDVILSKDKNPEFFEGLCKMCKEYYPKLPSNKNGFSQEDLNKIIYIRSDFQSESYFKDVTSLDELQYFYNLEKIYSWSFYRCEKLKSIIFPENLKVIQDNAFGGCNSLKELKIPENIQFISDHAFIYCDSLEKITILNKNVLILFLAFSDNYSSLKELTFPKKYASEINSFFHKIDLTKVNITYI